MKLEQIDLNLDFFVFICCLYIYNLFIYLFTFSIFHFFSAVTGMALNYKQQTNISPQNTILYCINKITILQTLVVYS